MNNKRVKDYLSTLKCSELTKNSYKYDLKVFYNYCESVGKQFEKLEIVDIETFFTKCIESGRSKRTILRYKVSLNKFFKYLLEKEYVKKNIIDRVQVENSKNSEIFCRANECKRLHEYFEKSSCFRDKIIFTLIYLYGVNPQEIVNIKISDFNSVNETVELKNRTLILNHYHSLDIAVYIRKKNQAFMPVKSKYIFTSQYGETFSRVSIYKSINKKAKELNIKVSPRDLRKYAIFKMLKYMNVEDVAKQLGISVERVLAYKGAA